MPNFSKGEHKMSCGIEIKNLRKEFGSLTAVDNLSLTINEGEIFAFLGVNGAGKTTTIRMLAGLTVPTSGDAKVLGHSIISELDEVKKLGNLSPQETSVAPNLTVAENLKFIAGIYGLDRKRSSEKAAKLREAFNLEEVWNKKAKTLSGGYQRKVSIAMALITDPKILYLDEPTLGLDVLARRELWHVIEALKGKVTIVLTTHYMEEAEALSDRIAIMVKGRKIEEGTMEELRKKTGKEKLEDIFVSIVEEMQ